MNNLKFLRYLLPIALAWVCLGLFFSITRSSSASSEEKGISKQNYKTVNATQTITIGVAVDLSGPVSSLGWAEANSVQLAINQTNTAGGILLNGIPYTLTLVIVDDQCNPSKATEVAQTMIQAGAVAVVGHTCTSTSLVAQAFYQAAGIAMISPSATGMLLTQQGYTNTFRTVPHDGSAMNLLATYFHDDLNLSRSAIIESWWLDPGNLYSSAFSALGGTITGRYVVTDTSQFTSTLTSIQGDASEAIANFYMSADYATDGGLLSKTAHELGMEEVVIGWNADSNDEALLNVYEQAAGALAAENDYAVMKGRRFQDMPGWEDFLVAYQAANFSHESTDPGIYGVYAYDAAGIIISAIGRAQSTDAVSIRDQIAATKNYAGVIGTYRGFDENGDVIPQWVWLARYQGGQWNDLYPTRLFLPAVLRSPNP